MSKQQLGKLYGRSKAMCKENRMIYNGIFVTLHLVDGDLVPLLYVEISLNPLQCIPNKDAKWKCKHGDVTANTSHKSWKEITDDEWPLYKKHYESNLDQTIPFKDVFIFKNEYSYLYTRLVLAEKYNNLVYDHQLRVNFVGTLNDDLMSRCDSELVLNVTLQDMLSIVHNQDNDFGVDCDEFSKIVENILLCPKKTRGLVEYIKSLRKNDREGRIGKFLQNTYNRRCTHHTCLQVSAGYKRPKGQMQRNLEKSIVRKQKSGYTVCCECTRLVVKQGTVMCDSCYQYHTILGLEKRMWQTDETLLQLICCKEHAVCMVKQTIIIFICIDV